MRSVLAFGALSACLLSAAPAPSEEAVPAGAVQEHVKNLGHPRFSERQKAARAIAAIGEPALSALRGAVDSADGEVRTRAAELIARIERQASHRKILQAPTIRLKFDGTPLRAAVTELNKKTGLNLQIDEKRVGNASRPVTVDTGEVPIWEAVEQFLVAAGLTESDGAAAAAANPADVQSLLGMPQPAQPQIWTSWSIRQPTPNLGNRILLVDGKASSPSDGRTLVRVRALPRDFPGNAVTKGSGEVSLTLDVTPSPSVAWQGLVGVEIRQAVDEHGQNLTQSHLQPDGVDGPAVMWDGGGQVQAFRGGWAMQPQGGLWLDSNFVADGGGYNPRHVPVSLLSGARASRTLRALEGVVTARVLTPPQTLLAVPDVLKASSNAAHRVDSFTLQVAEAKELPNGGVSLRLRSESPSMNQMMQFNVRVRGRQMAFLQMDSFGGPLLSNGPPQYSVVDAAGKPLRMSQSSHMNSTDNGMTHTQEMQFVFHPSKGQQGPYKLVATGRRTVELDVPFRLKNVPLP